MCGKVKHGTISLASLVILFISMLTWLSFGRASKLVFGTISFSGEKFDRAGGLAYLALQLIKRTSVEVEPEPQSLALNSNQVFDYPLLIASGSGSFPVPGQTELALLRRHLRRGGTLLLDDIDPDSGNFTASAVKLAKALFPHERLEPVPKSHTVFKSFYLLDRAYGRKMQDSRLLGVNLDGRMALFISRNDLLGAFQQDNLGGWALPSSPGGDEQRELALRLAINIVYYALCLDYKDDQVHAPFIIERRRK
ncbi:MAG: DUF4159 domain-containing protein [Deltaproteobacteria bacterium]|nr:DUF4159 domain-containing protein [Deltaproteobacteria bacterium]